MTKDFTLKFLSAMESAGITNYQAKIDDGTNMYNSDNSLLIFSEPDETFINVRQKIATASDGFESPFIVTTADASDVHSLRLGGSLKQVREFLEALGVTLTDNNKDVLIKIDKGNYNINPLTGDYLLAGFKVLSDEEIAKLSNQEKLDYEEKLKLFNERKKMPVGQVVQIDV